MEWKSPSPAAGIVIRSAVCCALLGVLGSASAGGGVPAVERGAQTGSCNAFYVDIPSAGNPLANMMLGSVVGGAAWMDGLKSTLALGAQPPRVHVVAGGQSEAVVRKAVQAALGTFKEQRLPYLTLSVVGPSQKLQALRGEAEQRGITFRDVPPVRTGVSPSARAQAYMQTVCEFLPDAE